LNGCLTAATTALPSWRKVLQRMTKFCCIECMLCSSCQGSATNMNAAEQQLPRFWIPKWMLHGSCQGFGIFTECCTE
jgi:hypothetical protein